MPSVRTTGGAGRSAMAWQRIGGLSATTVVVASYVLLIAARLLLDGAPLLYAAVGILLLVIVHCVLRDSKGYDVFGCFAFPGATASLAHDIAGAPQWIGFPLLIFGVLLARSVDRETQDDAGPASVASVP